MKEIILTICGIVGAFIANAFGGWDAAIATLLIFMGVDLLSGFLLAAVFHSSPKSNGGALGILDTACNSANWTADKFPIDQILTSSAFSVASVATNLEKVTNPAVLATGKIDHIPFYATIVYAEV